MAVRRWTASFGSLLEKDLVTLRCFPGGEYGHVFANDIQWGCIILWFDDERFSGHFFLRLDGSSTRMRCFAKPRDDTPATNLFGRRKLTPVETRSANAIGFGRHRLIPKCAR